MNRNGNPHWTDNIIADLDEYWTYEDPTNRKLVTLKKQTGIRALYLYLWKRFTVKELYIWMKGTWSELDMLAYSFPMRHDNFQLTSEVEKVVPRAYQIGKWMDHFT